MSSLPMPLAVSPFKVWSIRVSFSLLLIILCVKHEKNWACHHKFFKCAQQTFLTVNVSHWEWDFAHIQANKPTPEICVLIVVFFPWTSGTIVDVLVFENCEDGYKIWDADDSKVTDQTHQMRLWSSSTMLRVDSNRQLELQKESIDKPRLICVVL